VRVSIEDLGSEKHHQVAGDVKNQVREEQDARHTDDQLGCDQRTDETPSGRHVMNSIRNGLTPTNSER
jgi:hypothetical protein